ncbi:MAG TPA: ribonuclease PH [Polyangiaceae bacterium]
MSRTRTDRAHDALREPEMTAGFQRLAEGSVLYRAGGTVVLATASVDEQVPDFLKGKGEGWVTAEYQMHPRSNPHRREKRDGRERPLGGRSREIERLVGRSLRAAINRKHLGERQIIVDCDVLEADGGTRTASISAGFVAMALAIDTLRKRRVLEVPIIEDQVAAVSVGHVGDALLLDLCYAEDCQARVDLNLVATDQGQVVEIQGTAEGRAVPRQDLDKMIDLGLEGIRTICARQRAVLESYGVPLNRLLRSIPPQT